MLPATGSQFGGRRTSSQNDPGRISRILKACWKIWKYGEASRGTRASRRCLGLQKIKTQHLVLLAVRELMKQNEQPILAQQKAKLPRFFGCAIAPPPLRHCAIFKPPRGVRPLKSWLPPPFLLQSTQAARCHCTPAMSLTQINPNKSANRQPNTIDA